MLIKIMKNRIQERISHEVSQAQYYSILVDSAEDISSIVIWYVLKGITCERLLSTVPILMVQNNKMLCACSFLFNLFQNLATFLKASYKRMVVWIEVVRKHLRQEKMKRLKLIGETRWSGKSNAAASTFGHIDDATDSTFVDLLTYLSVI